MRIGKDGQQWIGEDVVDIWKRVNLDATSPMWSVFHTDIHQVWFYVCIDGSNTPNFKLVFDTRLGRFVQGQGGVRYGWATHDGESAKAYCGCMFSETVGASMSRKQKPYIGYTVSTAIWKADTSDLNDNGNSFKAYIYSKPYMPWGVGKKGGMVHDAHLIAATSQGASVTLTLIRDEGAESRDWMTSLDPVSDGKAETRVFPVFQGAMMQNCKSLAAQIGDIAPVDVSWNLDALIMPTESEGDVA